MTGIKSDLGKNFISSYPSEISVAFEQPMATIRFYNSEKCLQAWLQTCRLHGSV